MKRKLKKPPIKKLRYPLWFSIIFYIMTAVAPLALLFIQGLNSPDRIFRITFAVFSVGLVVWVFVRKFVIKDFEERLQKEKVSLQHDYSIEAGAPLKIKWLWYTNELWLILINFIQIVLIGGLLLIIAAGIQAGALKIKASASMIAILYVLAYGFKTILVLKLKGNDPDYAEEINNKEVDSEDGQGKQE